MLWHIVHCGSCLPNIYKQHRVNFIDASDAYYTLYTMFHIFDIQSSLWSISCSWAVALLPDKVQNTCKNHFSPKRASGTSHIYLNINITRNRKSFILAGAREADLFIFSYHQNNIPTKFKVVTKIISCVWCGRWCIRPSSCSAPRLQQIIFAYNKLEVIGIYHVYN